MSAQEMLLRCSLHPRLTTYEAFPPSPAASRSRIDRTQSDLVLTDMADQNHTSAFYVYTDDKLSSFSGHWPLSPLGSAFSPQVLSRIESTIHDIFDVRCTGCK
jgi:hypothetical protein